MVLRSLALVGALGACTSSSTGAPDEPTTPQVATTTLNDALVATGGITQLEIADASSSTATSIIGPFTYDHGTIRATNLGNGKLSIDDDAYAVRVSSGAITDVRLVPTTSAVPAGIDPRATPRPVWPALHGRFLGDTDERIELLDWTGAILVDLSLHPTADALAAGVEQRGWDLLALPRTPGAVDVAIAADSIRTPVHRALVVVDHVDEIRAEVIQPASAVGQAATVCFHAFTDGVEIATAPEIEITGAASANETAANCADATALDTGTLTLGASIGEVTQHVDFAIAAFAP
jgi:hypothetical protein